MSAHSEVALGQQIFAGVGLGLLVGLLVGLSSSPVVASIVGALAAGMITLLGYAPKTDSAVTSPITPGSAWRLGSFGLACALGVLTGIYTRANDLLSPSPKQQIVRLTNAGFTTDEARHWVLAKNLGAATDAGSDKQAGGRGAGVSASVLFAESGEDLCQAFDPANYQNAGEQLRHMQSLGAHYRAFAQAVQGLDDPQRAAMLDKTKLLFCAQ